mgnify:FL=1
MAAMITDQEFWTALANMPEPKPVSWRLYYDDQGAPVCYSMEDLPGNYIEVDAETYARSPMNLRVVDGQIRYIISVQQQKLVPSVTGTACDPRDITVVVDPQLPHQAWSRTINETS